jgi:hypothetical protein
MRARSPDRSPIERAPARRAPRARARVWRDGGTGATSHHTRWNFHRTRPVSVRAPSRAPSWYSKGASTWSAPPRTVSPAPPRLPDRRSSGCSPAWGTADAAAASARRRRSAPVSMSVVGPRQVRVCDRADEQRRPPAVRRVIRLRRKTRASSYHVRRDGGMRSRDGFQICPHTWHLQYVASSTSLLVVRM